MCVVANVKNGGSEALWVIDFWLCPSHVIRTETKHAQFVMDPEVSQKVPIYVWNTGSQSVTANS